MEKADMYGDGNISERGQEGGFSVLEGGFGKQ